MDFREFLQQTLPLLGLAWRPHHRRGVRRRCVKRLEALRLRSWRAYHERIQQDIGEREILRGLLTVTVSRFFRDSSVFHHLEEEIFPKLLKIVPSEKRLWVWCAGCANGEEPYSLAMIWNMRFHTCGDLVIEGQDLDPACIQRALQRRYRPSSLREVPAMYRRRYFEPQGDRWLLRPEAARQVRFFRGDLWSPPTCRTYHLILCRNTAFTYGVAERQLQVLERLRSHLILGGYLVIGLKERLPQPQGWREDRAGLGIFERVR